MNPDLLYALLAAAFWIAVAIVCHYSYWRKNKPGKIVPMNKTSVIKDYKWLLERIRGASTTTEIAWCQNMAYEFEETHRSHCDTSEYFSSLMSELQMRSNRLALKKIKVGLK